MHPAFRWVRRWLAAHGDDSPDDSAAMACARALRYPNPVGAMWLPIVTALDRVGPALAMGDYRRASELDDEAFDVFEQRLQQHNNPLVRMLFLMGRNPAYEVLYSDEQPEPVSHPLQKLDEQIRLGRAHSNGQFDVVVIGSGAGGAPVATELSRKGLKVAIVESGSLFTAATTNEALEHYFVNQGMVTSVRAPGSTLVMAGNAIGGTTAINSGTSLRPRSICLAHWDELLGTAFADGELDPYLSAVEKQLRVAPIPRDLLNESSLLVEKGLAAIGRSGSFALSRNAPGCKGSARCCFGCPTGSKQSTDRSYLPHAIRAGAVLFAQARATSIVQRAKGVDVYIKTETGQRRLRSKKLVIAGGALFSPLLIRRNKLGERWKVAGDHLRIHPASKVFGLMPEPISHHGVPQALGYKPPDLPHITFEGAYTPLSVTAPMISAAGQRHRWWMDQHANLANYGLMCRDRNTGWVRQLGGQIVVDYQLHPDDALDMGAGLLLASEALFAAGAERVILPLSGTPPEAGNLHELRRITPEDFRRNGMAKSGFHAQGTAGMGRVVDVDLALMGCRDIYVCDASVLPGSPGVNPQVTIMALSMRLADHLLGQL
ncbi:MAG: GMC family oxidoreductase [Proteobacteria bacterium]|nr:GMC family oxidoreductase [Pseudomonadota bacterium]